LKAMLLEQITNLKENQQPLKLRQVSTPKPGPQDVLIKVLACGVCHTELDEIEGRTPPPELPVILGHQVVGEVVERGSQANTREIGRRVGVAWIYSSCGHCEYCLAGEENLCPDFKATGRDANGGYAEYMIAPEGYTYPIPDVFSDAQAAPHLCAGAIGYRSLRLTGLKNGQRLGLTGFGASAHLVLKMVKERFPDTDVYVFSRNSDERHFAQELGAVWAGEIEASSPEKLHAIIDTTPVWKPVVEALRNLAPGGRLVINAIRKENVDQDALLKLDYPTHLWMEKEVKSVANVARRDVQEFLELAAQVPILPEVQEFALEDANQALLELKTSKIRGAKVLRVA
jgi:alcohol dehydrogenase, propanol-preferring